MPIYDVYGQSKFQKVMEDTWGHLRPKSQRRYTGFIVFTWAAYGGDVVIISAEFKGLDDSPWLYQDMQALVSECVHNGEAEEGNVYRWEGTYVRSKKGWPSFEGKLRKISLE